MSKVFITPKGTELPLMNLKGKDYLEVKWRIVWFREEKPLWRIGTRVDLMEGACLAKAHITDEHNNIMATSHKYETLKGFPDFIEKSETGAIGRALALLGFGTQFCADDLEEGSRIVDSPVQPREETQKNSSSDYVIPFGKKYKGVSLKSIPKEDARKYITWLVSESNKQGKEPSADVKSLIDAFDKLHGVR